MNRPLITQEGITAKAGPRIKGKARTHAATFVHASTETVMEEALRRKVGGPQPGFQCSSQSRQAD